ncbi:hypothetical protein [Streptomyces coelicoflavus]|uniref:hypothetical protein n=1 Tax=Streptomyces coelicoflavus TaxID=285562 RepID=UPI002E256927
MTDVKLQKARAAAAKAAEELAALEAAEAAKAAQIAAEREERAREYSRDYLTRWRELASNATKYERVDTYDPESMGFLEGIVRMATGREKRSHILNEARRAESVLEVPMDKTGVPDDRHFELGIVAHIERIIREEVRRRSAEFAEELEAQREAYVNGGGK